MDMSILIVDDNATNQLIIKTILNKAGYKDLKVFSSAHGLYKFLDIHNAAATEVNVDLILMDMMMPEIDGLEACKTILAVERYKDIPIIFVTAVGDSSKMVEAMDAGASDYVMKPINKLELLARIRSAQRLKREIDWHKERDQTIRFKLELAKKVQRNVLSQPISDEHIDISAIYQPSSELAGDFYEWHQIDERRYGAILLDVMGHGIASSLVCMYISSLLRDAITRIVDPNQVMHELNRYMQHLYKPDEILNYYFTAIYLVVDTEQKTIEYVNAGHPAGEALIDGQIVPLDQGCCAIGLFNNIEISKGVLHYQDPVKIMLYTDGLLEAMGDEQETKLNDVISGWREDRFACPKQALDHAIKEHVNGNQKDDICMVMIATK
jgi:sigma-B regulation protein RsbU (phosphoserine phosphatase)